MKLGLSFYTSALSDDSNGAALQISHSCREYSYAEPEKFNNHLGLRMRKRNNLL